MGFVRTGTKSVDVVDAIVDVDRLAEGKSKYLPRVKQVVKNPYGSKGKPDLQQKINELTEKATSELKTGEKVLIEKKIQLEVSNRRPDVQIIDIDGKTRKVFEAERNPVV